MRKHIGRAAAAAIAAALLLALAGCGQQHWAHARCRAHGGVAVLDRTGDTWLATCKDGATFTRQGSPA